MTMCKALSATTTRFDGEMVHLMGVAEIDGVSAERLDRLSAVFPMKLGQAGLNSRAGAGARSR
jgi:hypothetical protein